MSQFLVVAHPFLRGCATQCVQKGWNGGSRASLYVKPHTQISLIQGYHPAGIFCGRTLLWVQSDVANKINAKQPSAGFGMGSSAVLLCVCGSFASVARDRWILVRFCFARYGLPSSFIPLQLQKETVFPAARCSGRFPRFTHSIHFNRATVPKCATIRDNSYSIGHLHCCRLVLPARKQSEWIWRHQ